LRFNPPRLAKNPNPMAPAETSFQLLYVSHLAPGADFAVVKGIVDVARLRNPAHGITGALLFDGERFCQLIEGAEHEVGALMQSIGRDPRHTNVRVLFSGPSPGGGHALRRWVSGYCDAIELEAFDGETGVRDADAVQAFLSVLQGADVE
jgi:Sensors of blue-light using FAD